jgi:hypothetical protein
MTINIAILILIILAATYLILSIFSISALVITQDSRYQELHKYWSICAISIAFIVTIIFLVWPSLNLEFKI